MKLIVKTFQEITIKSRRCASASSGSWRRTSAVLRDLDPELKVEGEWDNLEVETAVVDAKVRREMIERLTCTRASVISSRSTSIRWAISTTSSPCKAHFGDQLAGKTFAVRCKRAGKHAFTSMEVGALRSAAACAANAGLPGST